MVDFELYRIFVTVANEGNITKASMSLNISQPAVTKRIHNLENMLNTRLFDRSKSGMRLTSNGKKLYDKINESVIILENAEKLFNTVSQINIGTRVVIFSRLFGTAIAKFYNLYPEINLKVEYLKTEEIMEKLKFHKIDIAIYRRYMLEENEDIKFIKLGETHDVFFVNKNYYKEMNRVFSKEDIKKETIYISDPNSGRAKNIIQDLHYSEEEKKKIKYIRNTTMLEMLKTEKRNRNNLKGVYRKRDKGWNF